MRLKLKVNFCTSFGSLTSLSANLFFVCMVGFVVFSVKWEILHINQVVFFNYTYLPLSIK